MEAKWTPGRVVWREHLAPDVEKAKGFYGEVFGWKFQAFPMGEMTYWVIMEGERGLGGIMQAPPGVPPCFMSYVSVQDVDAVAQRVEAEGGKVVMGPADLPEVGRMAVFSDFAGAHLCVLRGAKGDDEMPERPPVGWFCWETNMTTDVERAKGFYNELFGWTTQPGPGGQGAVFLTKEGTMAADLQATQPGVPPHWLTYVHVASLADTKARFEKLGGKVLMPNIEVPGVGNIAIVQDTTGAVLGLFHPSAS